MKMPCIGDFEASGLNPKSYPIEIAWSLPNGDIRSRLITPDAAWGDYWDPGAQELHGIERERLYTEGVAPAAIAEEMNRDLAQQTLYFDGGTFDRTWLAQLFEAANVQTTFNFGDFDTLLAMAGAIDGTRRVVSEALARKDLGNLALHRAAHDVRFLQRWYIRARGGMRY